VCCLPSRPASHPLSQAIAALPADAVLVDLPFGSLPYEVWWQYLSIGHWRARINGYSGDMPPGFLALDQQLGPFPDRLAEGRTEPDEPRLVLQALHEHRATHVLVHADAWASPTVPQALRAWLQSIGATRQATVGATEIWRLSAR
jgi:hypothetical protein